MAKRLRAIFLRKNKLIKQCQMMRRKQHYILPVHGVIWILMICSSNLTAYATKANHPLLLPYEEENTGSVFTHPMHIYCGFLLGQQESQMVAFLPTLLTLVTSVQPVLRLNYIYWMQMSDDDNI